MKIHTTEAEVDAAAYATRRWGLPRRVRRRRMRRFWSKFRRLPPAPKGSRNNPAWFFADYDVVFTHPGHAFHRIPRRAT